MKFLPLFFLICAVALQAQTLDAKPASDSAPNSTTDTKPASEPQTPPKKIPAKEPAKEPKKVPHEIIREPDGGITIRIGNPKDNKKEQTIEDRINLLKRIIGLVKRDHVEPKKDDELFKAAVNGMLSALDPHSAWLDPRGYKNMQVSTRGKFGGLGIQVTMENGYVLVVAPLEDTPAHAAGLLAGDLITHLNKKPVQGMTLDEAVEIMRGQPKTSITLTIKRKQKKPFDITLVRDIIVIKAVKFEPLDAIAYLRLTTFNKNSARNLAIAIKQLQKENQPQAYILDLRQNPGGLLDQAVAVSDLFLDKGEIVSIRGRPDSNWAKTQNHYQARAGDILQGKPLIVLINGASASASEIVAGALQDHHRATILGTLSFGKGSVQTVRPLGPGNGALRLTTARYYTPSGRAIQALGVLPDIEVEQKLTQEEKEKFGLIRSEGDLRGHLDEVDEERQNMRAKSIAYIPEDRKKDTQLNYAINLLKQVITEQKLLVKKATPTPTSDPAPSPTPSPVAPVIPTSPRQPSISVPPF